jgi:tetratricopeptide (TPR) repeat protein
MKSSVINTILQNWTGQDDIQNTDVQVLEQVVKEHPYNASLQFILAKKYALIGSDKFKNQLQKTGSYFPSALQLRQSLVIDEQIENNQQVDEKLNSVVSAQLAQFKESVSTSQLEFEKDKSQLVKDYFGAQGIEIDLEKIPQDKLTQQLRSFTSWLKVLKQQEGNNQNKAIIGEEQEKMIELLAEKANKSTDVITVAMAEIWENQGNYRKAIEIYSKLSFIIPEKSVYFASRIEQLKQKNK